MKAIFALFVTGILFIPPSLSRAQDFSSPDITLPELQQHIRFLASDKLGGRRSGEEGNRLAAAYIARQFEQYGLTPLGDDGSWFQNFTFIASTKEGEKNRLEVTSDSGPLSFRLDDQFKTLGISSDTSITAPLVFAGYGITAPDSLKYDDYAMVDVRNKIVVVLRYTPAGNNSDQFGEHASLMTKAMNARNHGAAGIIYLTTPPDSEGSTLKSFISPDRANAGLAAIALQWSVMQTILDHAGKSLSAIQQSINSTRTPNSFQLSNATATLQTQIIKITAQTANIVGFLPGNDPQSTHEALIIGAHMDHLGMGGPNSGSLSPDTLAVHYGADDNASGTAGLLELAQYFSAHKKELKRSILFLSFSGEELGTLGSGYYVEHPKFPLNQSIAMINLDMIGRMHDSALVVEGMGTSPDFSALVSKENRDSLKLHLKPDGYGPSDHAQFYSKDLPVMFFFTNLHSDYHRPSDTWDKINYTGEQKVVQLAGRIAEDLANIPQRPAFTKAASTPMAMGGDRGGVRVSLGVIPDFAEDIPGMKISGTRAGSPAEKAGLKGGDIITSFGGKDVKNLYDFTYLLGQHKPGDIVSIIVKRGTSEVTLSATLQAR